ncbi:MAG TPA: SUF system Fe-S cluster assembly regulator [Stellaceae bacterium]|jgi:FeS assembly SUF system regulator|nr:SUF system Fe-S cluster assembly regulator [Stellaceae bacterium]
MIILSKLADYAVIIATHLAVGAERQMTAASLAQEARLPRATVAKVLKALAHAGLVASARGAAGGYRLARPATAISIAELVAAIDGAIGLTQCTSHEPSCERSNFCPTRPHWHRINDAVGTALGAVSLADMLPPFAGFAPPSPAASRETVAT